MKYSFLPSPLKTHFEILGFLCLIHQLKQAGFKPDMRETILGHLQRGGVPIAYDRVLSAQMGVKAMEMAINGNFGKMHILMLI